MAKKNSQSYSEDNIRVLKGLAAVRKRPGMYMGERGDQMVWRIHKELVDNSIDESYAGRNDTVEQYIDVPNNHYIVADCAQGIPVGINKETGKSTLDVVFTELHGGGKFDDKAYKNSAGTHGVGAACSNALSGSFNVWTQREGQWYHREYAKGEPVGKLAKVKSPDKDILKLLQLKPSEYGTIISYYPDQSIVGSDSNNTRIKNKTKAELPVKQAMQWSRMIALMNPGLRMIIGTWNGKKYSFLNKGDISAVVKKIIKDNELSGVAKPLVISTPTVDLTLQWTSHDDTDLFRSYVNCSPTKDHGKHYEGFTSALGRILQSAKADVIGKKGKKEQTFKTIDALHGLVGILNFKMSEPEFSSQTKDRLTSHVNKDCEEVLYPLILKYFEDNKNLAKIVINRALAIAKGRDELKKVMKSVSDVRKNSRGMMLPNILCSADKAKPHERELYIVEGDSAGGTAKNARDSRFQEVFKLRGKLTNSSRTDMASLLKSQVIQNLLVALGVDLKSLDLDAENISDMTFNTEKLRVGNIMILTDADTDGSHIAVLLLSAINRLLPTLFEQGRVYICLSPLFLAHYKEKLYHGMTLEEVMTQLPENAKVNVTRAKGLGELDAPVLKDVAFDTSARHLIKVVPPRDADAQAYFQAITGSNSAARKELLGLH